MVKLQILIVEDDTITAYSLDASLRQLGYYAIAMTSTGEAAIEMARTRSPEVVLMDVNLKGKIDGVEAAQYIRAGLKIPVVFLTAHADRGTIARIAAVNPEGYIVKPYGETELKRALDRALTPPEPIAAAEISPKPANSSP
jgi:CheY-like chemotaxis protein